MDEYHLYKCDDGTFDITDADGLITACNVDERMLALLYMRHRDAVHYDNKTRRENANRKETP